MHIAPSGSPQPTKQAFICKLYSGFPRIFSQQKPHRRICIPQGARNEVLQETQPEPQIIFRRCFFRKTRKMSADVQAYFKRNLTPYSGNSARNLNTFFGDVFSQDKASKPPLYMHTARRKKHSFTGNSARTSNHFSVMFFSQDKENKRRRTSVLQAKFDAVFGKLSPKPQIIFRRCFFARQGF